MMQTLRRVAASLGSILDTVAILHDDPLHAGNKLSPYYGDPAAANRLENILDPAPYLVLDLEPETENKNSQSFKCSQP